MVQGSKVQKALASHSVTALHVHLSEASQTGQHMHLFPCIPSQHDCLWGHTCLLGLCSVDAAISGCTQDCLGTRLMQKLLLLHWDTVGCTGVNNLLSSSLICRNVCSCMLHQHLQHRGDQLRPAELVLHYVQQLVWSMQST